MILSVKKHIGQALGFPKFVPFGVSKESWGWRDAPEIDLRTTNAKSLTALERLLETQPDVHGVKVLLRDIAMWRHALKDASSAKPRTVRHFEALLQSYLSPLPHHRVFQKAEHLEGVWLPFYVNGVDYHAEQRQNGHYHPAYVRVKLVHEQFGGQRQMLEDFYESDLRGMTVVEALARKGYYAETEELRALHIAEIAVFSEIHSGVGRQFLCSGIGLDDVDGNPASSRESWYWRKIHAVPMEANGDRARVVMDLFYEEPKEDERDVHIDTWFWPRVATPKPARAGTDDDDDDDDDSRSGDEEFDQDINDRQQQAEIPIHPYVVVFDLAKHLRFRVHVGQLTEYIYDPAIADKLVLSEDRKALVRMLIEMKSGGFKDIVKGKSGGAVVLLAGPPGTGKTLTAEVYAESEGRALYSVQCSQLGTDPDALEDALLRVFARARRWNAVMLLDEADVYVHERGNDLQQNAIVGVFLRVLEYQDSVLFLTTNRPDDVDDAIASRCIARLTYEVPSPVDQARIWRVLADGASTTISHETIGNIVVANPRLSGRDVKNLLKLARLVEPGREITADAVEFVKQFKPTRSRETA